MSNAAEDTLLQPMSPALLQELNTLRDQRDLYRSLLMSDPGVLAAFFHHALRSVETIRSTLRQPTRQAGAFREKMEQLQRELQSMDQAMKGLQLSTVQARLHSAAGAIQDIVLRPDITGNDLLPAMVLLEELCGHLLVACNSAALHVPPGDEAWLEEELQEDGDRRPQHRIAMALHMLCEKLCEQYGKRVGLITIGLEDIPDSWGSALFDLLGQLVRNTIEHGIEAPAQRVAAAKPEAGSMAIEFIDRGSEGYDLNVQDDGAGLNVERIAEAAVRLGLLKIDPKRPLAPNRVINLIFQPGVSTAHDAERRGLGMQIVREQVQRLNGKLNIAAKRGRYVRFHITLPVVQAAQS
jgi:signal transduction histidine kinase